MDRFSHDMFVIFRTHDMFIIPLTGSCHTIPCFFFRHSEAHSVDGMKRIVAIWLERNVYEEHFIRRLLKCVGMYNGLICFKVSFNFS